MYNIGKYLLLVEKRVDINPLKPSVVHKNHDKSVLFHSYIHSILYKVPILFTSCREHFSQNAENQFFASKAKPYINFNKVSNKRLDNFSKVIEASFECSWSIGSLRLHGWRHHSRCNSILVRTDCVI